MQPVSNLRLAFRHAAWLTGLASLACGTPAVASNPHAAPSVEMVREISFGIVALGPEGGRVTVTPDGALSCMGGLQCLGGQNAGAFTITGAREEIVAITISPATLSDGAGHSLAAVFFPSDRMMVLRPGNAKNPFTVGGTLTASAAPTEGSYSGTVDVIVDYQ